MKNQNMQDERIIAQRRLIQSRGYAWLVLILLASVLIQQFVFKAPFAQYAVEFFLMVGCGIYNIICTYQKGIDIWNPQGDSKGKILLTTVVSGGLFTALVAVLTNNRPTDLAFYFIGFVLFFFAFRMLMATMGKRKSHQLDKALDDEDEQ